MFGLWAGEQVVMKETKRMCGSKPIVTVNGLFPGPTIYAREDDSILVKVVNHVPYNISIHWHGIRQLRTCWADGPAYITQCPIQPSRFYTYNFTLTGQRGTLLWHAHILWLRSTLHGALVILPKLGVPYPFPTPHQEKRIVLGLSVCNHSLYPFLLSSSFQPYCLKTLVLTVWQPNGGSRMSKP